MTIFIYLMTNKACPLKMLLFIIIIIDKLTICTKFKHTHIKIKVLKHSIIINYIFTKKDKPFAVGVLIIIIKKRVD